MSDDGLQRVVSEIFADVGDPTGKHGPTRSTIESVLWFAARSLADHENGQPESPVEDADVGRAGVVLRQVFSQDEHRFRIALQQIAAASEDYEGNVAREALEFSRSFPERENNAERENLLRKNGWTEARMDEVADALTVEAGNGDLPERIGGLLAEALYLIHDLRRTAI